MGKELTKLSRLLRTGAWSMPALALAAMALPAEAFAQDRGRDRGGEASQTAQQAPQDSRGDRGWNGERGNGRGNDRAQNGTWRNRGERAEAHRQSTGQSWNRRGDAAAPAAPAAPARAVRQDQAQVVPQAPARNRSYADPNRNRSYRDGRRDDNPRGENWRNQDRQSWRDNNQRNEDWRNRNGNDRDNWRDRDGRRWSNDGHRRNWDRNWRNNNRYDWNRYRNSNRHTYRLGRYYAPYHNYHYRRLSIGLFLNSLFYSNRYWIDDPWQYRLPAAYGPYKWVRYYDDALLVDIYTGEVVDVIHSFFW